MGSDKVSNIGAVPVAHDEKIVGFSKCIQAPAEAYIEIIEVVSLASNLICHALYNEKKVLRSVRQFPHDAKLTCSSCRRRTATSALNAKLGTETLIMNVSRRRKDSLRLLRTNGPAFDIVPHTAKHERRSAMVAVSR